MTRLHLLFASALCLAVACSSESTNVGGTGGAGGSSGGNSGTGGGTGGTGTGGSGGTAGAGGSGGDASTDPCTDGVKNGDETAQDCGGSCSPCDNGKGCKTGADCVSKVCDDQQLTCTPPDCTDGQTNGQETAPDCGGPACPKCADGKACANGSDCSSGVCVGSVCQAPSCSDGLKNGSETGVDCGSTCTTGQGKTCKDGEGCGDPSECASGVCIGSPVKTCAAATCTDTAKNGSETDLNCGGGSCPKCADGLACGAGTDCTSGVCSSSVCQVATCNDGVKNGAETDQDCGSGCPKCANGKACAGPADCTSGVCLGNLCLAPTCSDNVKNGNEGDIDCGGSQCAGCAAGKSCGADADCTTGLCSTQKCERWSKDFATANWETPLGFAMSASGRTAISGQHLGADLNFGAGKLDAGVNYNAYVAVHDVKGSLVWARSFGNAVYFESALAVAMDASDNVHALVAYAGELDLGAVACPKLTVSGPIYGLAVVKLAAATGTCLGQTSLVTTGGVPGNGAFGANFGDIAVNAAGVVAVTATVNDGDDDVLVARIDGGNVWQKKFSGATADAGMGVGLNATGDVFVTGFFHGSLDIANPALTAVGGHDLFVARLDNTGATAWAKRWGCANPAEGPGPDRGEALLVDGSGDVFVGGALIPGGCDLGNGSFNGTGDSDAFVAKYKGSDGSYQWSAFAGSAVVDVVTALGVGPGGRLAIGGHTAGSTLSFGEPVGAGGSTDAFVATFSPAGAHVDSLTISGAGEERVIGLAYNTQGGLVAYGPHGVSANVGFSPLLAGAAAYDLYLVSWGSTLP